MLKEKASLRLFLCLFFIYTMNTFTKIAFSAVTAALINDGILTKTQAGTVSGVFWFIYAIGQFIGGTIANRYPIALLKLGLIGGAVTNFLMAFSGGFIPMLVVWSLNGILQFGFWPSVLSLLSNKIIPEQRSKSFVYIAYCYGVGSILSHLCTATVLSTLTWNWVFICCGFVSLISAIPVIYMHKSLLPVLTDEDKKETSKKEKESLPKGFVWKSGIVFFCIMFCIKSVSESGIKTWMPTILMETYGVTPSFTSVLSVVLLLLNLFGVSISSFIYRRVKENEVSALFVLYASIVPLMLMLTAFRSMNAYIATVIFSVITVMLYGSGQVLSTYYPSRFQKFGGTAFIGGVMNCFAAMGNVIAAYANGLIADLYGWDMIIRLWNIIIIVFVVLTIILTPIWNKFRKEQGIK